MRQAVLFFVAIANTVLCCSCFADRNQLTTDGQTDPHRVSASDSSWMKYERSSSANEFISSSKVPFGIWLNGDVWAISDMAFKNVEPFNYWPFNNWYKDDALFKEVAELSFYTNDQDVYATMTNENVSIPYEQAKKSFIDRVTQLADESCVLCEEKRLVNGIPVTYMRMDVVLGIFGINYMVYFCCEADSTTTLATWSLNGSFAENEANMEAFLNGLSRTD